MQSFEEQVDLVRNWKGAAASIMWILLLTARSLTGKELARATGYSDKPVTDALAWLEPRGWVQNNGRQHGWSLAAGQLHLPGITSHSIPEVVGGDRNNSDDRKLSDLADACNADDLDLSLQEREQPTLQQDREDRNFSEDTAVALRAAGVRGRAVHDLATAGIDAVDVWGWWWWSLTEEWLNNPPGYLIDRLRCGERAPAGFRELARTWPDLAADVKREVMSCVTGVDDGRLLAQPCRSSAELSFRLDGVVDWSIEALAAVLTLVNAAPEVLESESPTTADYRAF